MQICTELSTHNHSQASIGNSREKENHVTHQPTFDLALSPGTEKANREQTV